MRIDDDMLMAYADGELSAEDRIAVEAALAADPALRAALDEQKRLRTTLAGHYAPVAIEAVPERLLAMLGASAPDASVASLDAARARRGRPAAPLWRNLAAIAATLMIGLFAGQLFLSPASGPIGVDQGVMIAQGELATALETQLASAQPADAATRIGVSFEDKEGRLCRTFDATALSGVACKQDGDWAVALAAATAGPAAAEYRQAGSSHVLATAQEMMAGAPLDAAAEAAARKAGWKKSPRTD